MKLTSTDLEWIKCFLQSKSSYFCFSVKTSSNLEDGIGDSLSLKLSRKLNGKPVFVHWAVSAGSLQPGVELRLEKTLFAEMTAHPEMF